MKKTILIYEPRAEQVSHLIFLLHLADIRGTHARTAAEAINWLAAYRLLVISFDLVLICSLCTTEAERLLLEELPGLPLPVVFLQRDDMPLAQASNQHPIVCHPDDLLSCLNDCLASKATQPKEQAL